MTGQAIVGLAKENEELFLPGEKNPVILPRDAQSLFLVQRVRDEAHRFAVNFHRQKRGKTSLHSKLDDVPGVGPKKRAALIKQFGSLQGVRAASLAEITTVAGINPDLAERIKSTI